MKLPKPFLGRLLVEVIRDDAEDHLRKQYKMENSVLQLPETMTAKKLPVSKGRILEMAPDAFGRVFKERYGDEMECPAIGDVVWFIPNESYRVDSRDTYHIVADQDIVAFEKGEEKA